MQLVLGVGLVAVAVFVLVFAVLAAPRIRRSPVSDDPRLHGTRDPLAAPERALDRVMPTRWRTIMAVDLELAGSRMSPARLVIRTLAVGVTVALIVGLLTHPVLGLLVLVAAPLLARFILSARADRLRRAFEGQLDDTLQLLASALRAGSSVLRAIDTVAEEAPQPTARAFARAVNEVRLGRDLGEVLAELGRRMKSTDFAWVSQAVDIHREVGGNLAEVLDQVADTIRERNELRRQVEALSADGRLSAWVLMGIPVGVVLLLLVVNPAYLAPLVTMPLGWLMVAASVVLFIAGGLWLRRIIAVPL